MLDASLELSALIQCENVVITVKIGRELHDFLQQFPSCEIICLTDLSTGMVLASNARSHVAHEILDELGVYASQVCASHVRSRVGYHFCEGKRTKPAAMIAVEAENLRCVVTAAPPHAEAMCLVLDAEASPLSVVRAASDFLSRVFGEP